LFNFCLSITNSNLLNYSCKFGKVKVKFWILAFPCTVRVLVNVKIVIFKDGQIGQIGRVGQSTKHIYLTLAKLAEWVLSLSNFPKLALWVLTIFQNTRQTDTCETREWVAED
jgi:hypothetical protein